MLSHDIWADAPYANYTYPLDSLLNGSDSLQYAEAMRMLRDVYVIDVESSQGANQIIKFCDQCRDHWLPSLFSTDSLALKLVLLALIALFAIFYLPSLRKKIKEVKNLHLLTLVALVLMLLATPLLGSGFYGPICLSLIGVIILQYFIIGILQISLTSRNKWLTPLFILAIIVTAFLNLTKPFPSFSQIRNNDNPIDNFFWVICSAVLLFTVFFLIRGLKYSLTDTSNLVYHEQKKLRKNKLIFWALFTWCFAYLLYFIGTYYGGSQRSMLTALFRPALSASKIFILADSLSDITLAFRRSGAFMGLISLARLSGLVVSAQVVISLIGERLMASFKMRIAKCKDSSLYVFFGINPASVQVVKTIEETVGKNPLAVFVDTAEEDISKSQSTFGFGNLISMFTHKGEAFEAVNEANKGKLPVLLTIASSKIEDTSSEYTSLTSISLQNLERLIDESNNTEFFFLSDNEEANITGAQKLTKLLKDQNHEKFTIYCHCRHNSLSQLLQFNDIRIEVVDFSELAINQLKSEPTGLLTDLVRIDHNGCCTSTLRSLIIGMGSTGEEAIRYLYEFGAFVNTHETRSNFECYVMDRNMKELEGDLYMRFPQLKFNEKKVEQNVRVELMQQKDGSEEFWRWLDLHINTLQFIMISVGNVDEEMRLADEIYNFAIKRRQESPEFPLRIFACAYSAKGASKLSLMAETYGKLNHYGRVELIPFGMPDKLFTYDNITKSKEKNRAKQYYDYYQMISKSLSGDETSWEQRRTDAVSSQSLASILEFLRKEYQDISNEYHRRTKIAVIEHALQQAENDGLGKYTLQDIYNALPETLTSESNLENLFEDKYIGTLIHNLAVLEHVRWKASHEILGFQNDKDVQKGMRSLLKKHDYLTDWENLPYHAMLYDYAVVFTTLKIDKNE
jgi:hypothetical protein